MRRPLRQKQREQHHKTYCPPSVQVAIGLKRIAAVARVHFVEAAVHLAVIEGVPHAAVEHQLPCGFGRIGIHQGLAQPEPRLALPVGIALLREDVQRLAEIFRCKRHICLRETYLTHKVAADGKGLEVACSLQHGDGFLQAGLSLKGFARSEICRRHLG